MYVPAYIYVWVYVCTLVVDMSVYERITIHIQRWFVLLRCDGGQAESVSLPEGVVLCAHRYFAG